MCAGPDNNNVVNAAPGSNTVIVNNNQNYNCDYYGALLLLSLSGFFWGAAHMLPSNETKQRKAQHLQTAAGLLGGHCFGADKDQQSAPEHMSPVQAGETIMPTMAAATPAPNHMTHVRMPVHACGSCALPGCHGKL